MQLIGREREVAEVTDRLTERRTVSLVGPAGVGKTALARHVAGLVGPQYPLGTRHVDLTRAEGPAAVPGVFAAQLGAASFESLLHSPQEQPVLVVVDNCEHVGEAAASCVVQLLEACEAPTVLATSRSPLHIPGESLVLVGTLATPPRGTDAVEGPAVTLFLERARDAGSTLGSEHLDAVAELCRRLDGLPLALELAAARTRIMAPAEIVERLDGGIDFLTRPGQRGNARHRSLGATIEWSYRLLPPEAGRVLDRLSLFPGPVPTGLAAAVAADTGLGGPEALDALQQLVDASFLVSEHVADRHRFRMLQTVRTFAVRQLSDGGEDPDARRQLADHLVVAAMELLRSGGRRWDMAAFGRLHELYDAMASSLGWCVEHDDEPTRALTLCSVLWAVVHQGHTEEIAALTEAAVARWPDPSLPFAADAAATVATARCLLGDHRGAMHLAELHLNGGHAGGAALVTLRRAIGYASYSAGDPERALTMFEEVSTLARRQGLLALALEADVTCAQLISASDRDRAVHLADVARAEAEALGSTVNEVWAHTVAAHLRLCLDHEKGQADVEEALEAARRLDYPAALSLGLRSLAWSHTCRGEHAAAAMALLELSETVVARSGVADVRGLLLATAHLLHQAGDPAWDPMAATAGALVQAGLAGSSIESLISLPSPRSQPAPELHDAVRAARVALRRITDGRKGFPIGTTGAREEVLSAPLRSPHGEPAASRADVASAPDRARFVRLGEHYEVTFDGTTVHLKASKGLRDVAQLLASPGREIAAVHLMGASVDQPAAGDTIDVTARRRYEERVRELQADLEEAEAFNDAARAGRLQAELDAIVDHLTAAMGLGGRARATGGSAERARSAVTQRIRSTIRRLRAEHPALARHLEVSVTTGSYCCYRPERTVEWDLEPPVPAG